MRFRFFAPLVGAALLAAACASSGTDTPTSAVTPTSVAEAAEDPAQQIAPSADSAGTSASVAGSESDAVLLDPRESGALRNHLGYEFPPAPEVPTGPIPQTAVDDLEFLWTGFQTEVNFSGLTVARLAQSGDPRLAWILSDLLRFSLVATSRTGPSRPSSR
ncbi:hypothetical protein [Candidatus Poriferisodalis sp.]|uniref:hypothetical protein n=1 Tax=Candidatus Poriferisodalis sp. TaxID=3101277 RepID=UPI003B52562E